MRKLINLTGENTLNLIEVMGALNNSDMINEVNIAFFGDSNQTAFYSVHDFFYKSM